MELGQSESFKIMDEGTVLIGNAGSNSTFNGLLMDKSIDVLPISHAFINGDYTVPDGKILYVYTDYQWTGGIINESGSIDGLVSSNSLNLLFKGGDILTQSDAFAHTFNGYLVDEDYFADCSGGGGSTTNSLAETDSGKSVLTTNDLCNDVKQVI